jgi:hypothetical protein
VRRLAVLLAVLLAVGAAYLVQRRVRGIDNPSWTTRFAVAPADLATHGRNPYFVLEPGYALILEDGEDRLVITVLEETRVVDGVETRVVEERETKAGQLIEVSRNFFALSARTNDVYYFGEDVETYQDGTLTGHEGAWASGANGARFGLMMPGTPLLGARFYQEMAPGVAMDRAEIVSLSDTLATPAGNFHDVLRVVESTPLEPGVRESKYYAAGVGLLRDGSLRLVRYGTNSR